MKIAPDIDAMMWDIANSRDIVAAENFSKRFPDLSSELSKRVRIVQDIRKARDLHLRPVTVPKFQPSVKPHFGSASKRATAGAALFAAAALAFGAFEWVSSSNWRAASSSSTSATCRTGRRPTIYYHNVKVDDPMAPASVDPRFRPQRMSTTSSQPAENSTPTASPVPPIQGTNSKPLHIALTQVPLNAALEAIGDQAGITLEPAPNMPNPTIDAKYDQMDGLAAIKDLGAKYGFDVVPDGDAKVLLIPKTSVSSNQN